MSTRQERLTKLGLSQNMYNEMVDAQGNTCLICGEEPSENRALAIDHDHRTGAIRGLLCGRCNMGLGYFRDNVNLLREAVAYLEHATLRYVDCCQTCQRADGDYDPRPPHRIDGNGKGSLVAYYRCATCGERWHTNWTAWPVHLMV